MRSHRPRLWRADGAGKSQPGSYQHFNHRSSPMSVAIITGSAGLVGSESASFFSSLGMDVVGIDNDMRASFFGEEASTAWNRDRLRAEIPRYRHCEIDIRDSAAISKLFARYKSGISLV